MLWDPHKFYKASLDAIFVNAKLNNTKQKLSFNQQVVRLKKYRHNAIGKLLQRVGPDILTEQFSKRLLNCNHLPTAETKASAFRCGSFICPYCFFRKVYIFCRDKLRPALLRNDVKYVGVTFSQSIVLSAPVVPGIFGYGVFDDSFIPPIVSIVNAEQLAAQLLTNARLLRSYEQLWFETDSLNCRVVEPQGGFSTTWFDYQQPRNVFTINRLSLHLTNTNALQAPLPSSINTRVAFRWHLTSDFDPTSIFGSSLTFPYGLYDALFLSQQSNDIHAGAVVGYLFGMRRLMDKFHLQQSWGSLHDRTPSSTRRRINLKCDDPKI
jgi:hypothetical protein